MRKRRHQILAVISMLLLLICMAVSAQAAPRYKNVLRKEKSMGKFIIMIQKERLLKARGKT